MNKRAAILTLLNVTAMADGQITEDETKMITEVLQKELDCSEEEITRGLEENTQLLKKNSAQMIKEAVLILRNECSVNEMKELIKLIKRLTTVDKDLDRREILMVELLTQLTT